MLTALVDYDNVAEDKEFGVGDVERNLFAIADRLIRFCSSAGLLVDKELRVRLYGGWVTERGTYSQRGEWLLGRVGSVRGLRMGIRLLPTVVTSILGCEELRLIGSFRQQRDFGTKTDRYVQKMVDAMLAVDILLFSEQAKENYVVVCDDDDIVPALIAAQRRPSRPAMIFRRRNMGTGLNDGVLEAAGCTKHGIA